MGAGILPITIYNNELYFLFGKENQFEKSAPGFSDFGGGSEPNESYLQTAIREGSEELTGFLGDQKEIKKRLKQGGTFVFDYKAKADNKEKLYRSFLFPLEYDDKLVYYYNNNQRFLQKHLDPKVIEKTRIFEKEEIRWFSIKDIKKELVVFRPFYRQVLLELIKKEGEIRKFLETKIKGTLRFPLNKKTRKNHKKL